MTTFVSALVAALRFLLSSAESHVDDYGLFFFFLDEYLDLSNFSFACIPRGSVSAARYHMIVWEKHCTGSRPGFQS